MPIFNHGLPIQANFIGSGEVEQFDYSLYGLPILKLTGDVSAMTKDNAVTLNYTYGDLSGTCTCKWQGSSSLSYPKKNYTIKFDNAFEAAKGWGAEKKYCLKANFIDHSHARNVVSAKLWGKTVKSRTTANEMLNALPNGGAVDGFPCIIELNGDFHGLYTWNIPKDGWMFGMNDINNTEYQGYEYISGTPIDQTTFAYTTQTAVSGNQVRKKSALSGGRAYWDFDATKITSIPMLGYLFDENGNPYRVFQSNTPSSTGSLRVGGEYDASVWVDPNTATPNAQKSLFNYVDAPFSVEIPNGCTVMWYMLVSAARLPDGTLTHTWSNEADKEGRWSMTWVHTGVQTYVVSSEGKRAIFCADTTSEATRFQTEATLSGDFELEYVADDNAGWASTSLNRLIRACLDSDGTDLDTTIAKYLDWDSAIDYFIFACLIGGADIPGKNYLLATYDGTKWFFSAYDLDSTFGLWWDGKKFLRENHYPTVGLYASYHKVMDLIYKYKKDALKARYAQLRAGALSEGAVAEAFCNFVKDIPAVVLSEDVKKWTTIPSSSVNNVAQILNWYRMRVAVIDKEIEQM